MTKEQLQWAMYEAYATQLLNRIEAQEAEIAKLGTMAEQARADAVTRAAADEKRITGLLTQIQDLRAETERLRSENQVMRTESEAGSADLIKVHDELDSLSKERDDLRAALEKEQELHAATALRLSTEAAKMVERKHPVEVGEWVRRTKLPGDQCPVGIVKQVTEIRCDGDSYGFADGDFWSIDNCEPCDPPTEATHDTPEGKDVAESVIRDDRSRDINDGDLVEVVSNTGRNTWLADVGSVGTVTSIETINDSISVRLDDVPGKKNVLAGYVSLCDVRKMTA